MIERTRKWLLWLTVAVFIYIAGSMVWLALNFVKDVFSTIIFGALLIFIIYCVTKIAKFNKKAESYDDAGT